VGIILSALGMRLEGWVAVIVSLRNNFLLTEGEKHCDESSHLTSRGHAHHGNGKYSPPFQLDRDLIASLDGSLHIVALRLEYPTALFISGAQLVGPRTRPCGAILFGNSSMTTSGL